MHVHVHTHTHTHYGSLHINTKKEKQKVPCLILRMSHLKYKRKSQPVTKLEVDRQEHLSEISLRNFYKILISILSQTLHRNKIF